MIEKSVLTAEVGWKINARGDNDAFNRIASERKGKFLSNVQEFADLRLGLLIDWVNYFLSTGADMGKAAVNEEKRKLEVREADRIARANKRLVQAAATNTVGPIPPAPIGIGNKVPPTNMNKLIHTPPNPTLNPTNRTFSTPQRGSQTVGSVPVVPPINTALVSVGSGQSSPRSHRQHLTEEIAKARSVGDTRAEEELLKRLSENNKRFSDLDTLPFSGGMEDEHNPKSPRHTK